MVKIKKIITKLKFPRNITYDIETLDEKEIEQFYFLNRNSIITLVPNDNGDEVKYLECLKRTISILAKHKRKYCIKIKINNRELLRQADILGTDNVDFIIHNDMYDYNLKEYLDEEEKLNKLIAPIKEANLSTFQKYLAVYNMVKNFKPYRENFKFPDRARHIRYILNNEYMVCVGYSELLKILLDKMDIPSIKFLVSTSSSRTKTILGSENHQRNIVKIDDDEYNIHGIYISDPTFDNCDEMDFYMNSCLTFDKKKEYSELEYLSKFDLILDFHNFEEFNTKVNFLIKQFFKKRDKSLTRFYDLIYSYKEIYKLIMGILSQLDYSNYLVFFNKYNDLLLKNKHDRKALEKIYSEFLTDYAMYMLPLTNNAIDLETLMDAAAAVKIKLNNYTFDELYKMLQDIEVADNTFFPYSYDPNGKDNYLESKEEEEENIIKK